MSNDAPLWLTPREAAAWMSVTPETVWHWIKQGHLRAINVARTGGRKPRWRISPIDVRNFQRERVNIAHQHIIAHV